MINSTDKLIVSTDDSIAAVFRACGVVDTFFKQIKYSDASTKYHRECLKKWSSFRENITSDLTDNTIEEILQISSSGNGSSRMFARYILFAAWANSDVLLPFRYNFSTSVSYKDRAHLGTELVKFSYYFKPKQQDIGEFGNYITKRLQEQIHTWIYSTDWHHVENVNLDDARALHSLTSAYFNSKKHKGNTPFVPVFLKLLSRSFQDRVTFSQQDLKSVKLKTLNLGGGRGLIEPEHNLSTPLAIIRINEYFKEPLDIDARYLLKENIYEYWTKLFEAYIKARSRRGDIESRKNVVKSLRVFCDYMSIYIPLHASQQNNVSFLIQYPKDVLRYRYIDQSITELNFPSYIDYCHGKSKNTETIRGWVLGLNKFFSWIEANHTSAPEVGKEFRNPIYPNFDCPRGARPSKTNKKPFNLQVISHLIKWCYAIEEFCCYAFENNIDFSEDKTETFIEFDQYGYVPHYSYMEEDFPVTGVAARILKSVGLKSGIDATILRLLMLSLETGIRVQTGQWLDRRTFDKLNGEQNTNQDVYWVFYNTDKVHGPWEGPVLARVRALLHRQLSFQTAKNSNWKELAYEGREYTRFEPIEPLFRDLTRNDVVADYKYNIYWKLLVEEFQSFAFRNNINIPLLCHVIKPNNVNILKYQDRYGPEYCPLTVKHLYTPHSARSTFITRRSAFIDIESIADLVGHSNSLVTSHYCVPEYADLSLKLEHADGLLQFGECREGEGKIHSNDVYIKAREKGSALQNAFKSNKDEAIVRYKAISLSADMQNVESVSTGIDMLKGSRASELIFRDTHICPVGEHCPEEVLKLTKEPMRCGTCQYACKTIENLPAIAAKRRNLMSRIIYNKKLYKVVLNDESRGDELEEIHCRMVADIQEYLGWTVSEEVLNRALQEPDNYNYLHTDEPEIVKRHLQRIVKQTGLREFVLSRILDAAEYPSLQSEELRIKASRLHRKIVTNPPEELENWFDDHFDDDCIRETARIIKARMDAEGLTIEQFAKKIEQQQIGTAHEPILLLDVKGAG